MDISALSAALSAISTAKAISSSAIAARDDAILKPTIIQMNDQLLKAQEALSLLSAHLLSVQQQLFETSDKLRKAEETIAERGRYTLVESGPGNWVYMVNILPEQSRSGKPGGAQIPHYVCQPCFDSGRKVVLVLKDFPETDPYLMCPVCKASFDATFAR